MTQSMVSLRVWMHVLLPEPALPLIRYAAKGSSSASISTGLSAAARDLNHASGGGASAGVAASSRTRSTIGSTPCMDVKFR